MRSPHTGKAAVANPNAPAAQLWLIAVRSQKPEKRLAGSQSRKTTISNDPVVSTIKRRKSDKKTDRKLPSSLGFVCTEHRLRFTQQDPERAPIAP